MVLFWQTSTLPPFLWSKQVAFWFRRYQEVVKPFESAPTQSRKKLCYFLPKTQMKTKKLFRVEQKTDKHLSPSRKKPLVKFQKFPICCTFQGSSRYFQKCLDIGGHYGFISEVTIENFYMLRQNWRKRQIST